MTERSVTWFASDDTRGMATVDFVASRPERRDVTGAVWLPPQVAGDELPLIVFGHGASGDRYQNPIPQLAQRFVNELGCPAMSMDGPVHGLRRVEPGGRQALNVERQRPTATADFIEDWHVAIDLAFDHEAIGRRPIAYFGLSMGSGYGIPMLAERDDVIVSTLGLLGTRGPFGDNGPLLLESAAKITHPVLYLMQLEDELFDRAGYLELFDALASDDKRIHANPGLHPQVPQEEILFAFEFMRKHIEGVAPRGTMAAVAD